MPARNDFATHDEHAAAALAEQARQLLTHPLTPTRVRYTALRLLAAGFGFELVDAAPALSDAELAEVGIVADPAAWRRVAAEGRRFA